MRLARKGTISGVYCFLGTDLLYRKEPTLVQIIPGSGSEIKHGALLQRVLDYHKGANGTDTPNAQRGANNSNYGIKF